MVEERDKLDVVGFLYGELDGHEAREVRRSTEADSQLAEELRSLERTRAFYAEASLPDPPDVLSEAILRQEKILRAEPEPWWTPMWRMVWHPAFGATAVLVVAVGAGLFYTVGETPQTAPTAAAPLPPTAGQVAAGTEAAKVAEMPAATKETWAQRAAEAEAEPEEKLARATRPKEATAGEELRTRDKRASGAKYDRPGSPMPASDPKPSPKPSADGVLYPTGRTAKAAQKGGSSNIYRSNEPGLAAGMPPADESVASKSGSKAKKKMKKPAKASVARKRSAAKDYDDAESDEIDSMVGLGNAADSNAIAGSPGQLTEPSILAQKFEGGSSHGSAGNVAPITQAPPAEQAPVRADSATGSSLGERGQAKQAPVPFKRRAGPTNKIQRDAIEQQRMRRADDANSLFRYGMQAYDTREYMKALDAFQRVQKLDTSKALMPGSLVMEARTLKKMKQFRPAARLYEQVLERYPKFKQRDKLLNELVACYSAVKDTALANRAKRRYSGADSGKRAGKAAAEDMAAEAEAMEAAEPAATAK